MKRAFSYWWLGAIVVLLFGMGVLAQLNRKDDSTFPRAQYADKTPLGGKGLRLLLEKRGFVVRQQTQSLKAIPEDAKVWLLLDPDTTLSKQDGKVLLEWVKKGGVLIWSNYQTNYFGWWDEKNQDGQSYMRHALHITSTDIDQKFIDLDKSLYPIIHQAPILSGEYNAGVHDCYLSSNTFMINSKNRLPIAGGGKQLQLAAIPHGKGRVIVTADAMIFTNYGMARGDTAVLTTNLIRRGTPHGAGIYFDERTSGSTIHELPHELLYYLWQPPLRWALFQLALAGLLLWVFYGRRLGRPVPIPVQQPVTRASQFAVAMAGLYQKARRPKVPLEVLGNEFRRLLIRRTGASPLDSPAKLAARCHEITGLPRERVQQLLERIQKPVRSDNEVLQLVAEMEKIREKLGGDSSV